VGNLKHVSYNILKFVFALFLQITNKSDGHTTRHALKACNKDKNQNLRVIPCMVLNKMM